MVFRAVMNPAQCRAARGLLNLTQSELAVAAGLSDVTIRNFENAKTELQPASKKVLEQALSAAGVVFLADGEMVVGGPGVRLK